MPASLGLIIASEQIINGLFGYGSFTLRDVEMTSIALKFFGYGVIAFAFVKILANFFFARNNTKTPFYISSFMVFLNIIISLSFFAQIGIFNYSYCNLYFNMDRSFDLFLFIEKNNYLFLEKKLFINFFKITISSVIMCIVLVFLLTKYSNFLNYTYNYKSIYLLIIVGFVGIVYLLSCYLLGLLKTKNYKTN